MAHTTNEYINERNEQVKNNMLDSNLQIATDDYLTNLIRTNYQKNFTWMGIPILQYPTDLIVMQELLWEIKPDLIIETGMAFGGMLLFYASILEAIGNGKVLGIEIAPREHNIKSLQSHPLWHRIDIFEMSSTDNIVLELIKRNYKYAKILISLDSLHTHDHVLQELKLYSPLVSLGSYIVVFDGTIEEYGHLMPQDRPWGKGNNPYTAVQEFMKDNDEFIVDVDVEARAGITAAKSGWLKRVKEVQCK